MIQLDQINLDSVHAELTALFHAYETALMTNDLAMLDQFFWQDTLTVRFGVNENLYGIEAIRAFRKARDSLPYKRILRHSQITTYGQDFATATTEFIGADMLWGRQSQTWVRFPDGWRVVSAHISLNSNSQPQNG